MSFMGRASDDIVTGNRRDHNAATFMRIVEVQGATDIGGAGQAVEGRAIAI